ncbi:methylated-DNA--[protein]-cysteine S-methyltransferase [Effusibacillus pohliae]|uniref:methylated-DNA--[protein]-cysteine S-methyltransferase n=1 Tax=Effusibacillus pohliae TaxID=232270 RepID=UPI00035FDF94|nr:methylated-DNA--[protein]-cysteine S-methyltransferase [Effusibacillus pohliae]
MKSASDGKIGYDIYRSPIGPIHVVVDGRGVRKVAMTDEEWQEYRAELGDLPRNPALCRAAVRQLDEYFKGERREFDLPLSLEGTEFRKRVWNELRAIPYGEVRSYAEIAAAIGMPQAPRAIGQANRANPLPILIPCHRVIGKNGDLVGYAGTRTDIKAALLRVEGYLR